MDNMVIINGRFLLHRVTGVERYAREILYELDKIVAPNTVELAIPPDIKNIPSYQNITIKRVGKLKNRLWEHISFPKYVKSKNAISLNLCNVAPLPQPDIVCIHDMKIKAHPEYFSMKFRVWYELLFNNEVKRAKTIVTVSEFSKREICKYYNIKPEKITVIPDAWQHYNRIEYDEKALSKYNLKQNGYYFAMGSMEPNKNFKWIAEIAKKMPDQIFAIAGAINEKIFSDGIGFDCPPNMKLLGFVNDGEAKLLMRECKGFLFPSIYEGFGIPPLEAMSAGCKNIFVSDSEVMHEIFGNSVSYIDSYSSEEKLISNEKLLTNKQILEKYSWKKSARLLYELIEFWQQG